MTDSRDQGRNDISSASVTTFLVMVNAEAQYSIWEARREVPAGWTPTGYKGTEPDCLVHISTVWTDMRPLSLRAKER